MGLLKVWNIEHKYIAIKTQLPKKTNGAHSSIEKKPIPPKDIDSQAWHFVKGPWEGSHNLGPIMSSHICITFLSKPTKKDMKEKERITFRVR
jgi:hypothetical protein